MGWVALLVRSRSRPVSFPSAPPHRRSPTAGTTRTKPPPPPPGSRCARSAPPETIVTGRSGDRGAAALPAAPQRPAPVARRLGGVGFPQNAAARPTCHRSTRPGLSRRIRSAAPTSGGGCGSP